MFRYIASRVAEHWNPIFQCANPLLEEICEWHGREYPVALDSLPSRARLQGVVHPDTEFSECIANARSYAAYHLMQLGEALDHPASATLRHHLGAPHQVAVVDIGCAAGILALFVDRCGFAQYIGIDSNPWMRYIGQLVVETTFNQIILQEGYASQPDYGVYGPFIEREVMVVSDEESMASVSSSTVERPFVSFTDKFDSNFFMRYVQTAIDLGHTVEATPKPITILVVMNHFLFQETDVEDVVAEFLELCIFLANKRGVHPFLLSIEPGTLYKPNRLGTQGLDRLLHQRNLTADRFDVTGLSKYLTGKSKGSAAVRLVNFIN